MNIRIVSLFVLLLVPMHILSKAQEIEPYAADQEEIAPLRVGNLKLASSQIPGPLFALGQNYVDKGDVLGLIYPDSVRGCGEKFNEILPAIIWQALEKFSLTVYLPVATRFQSAHNCSSGIEDIPILGEYAFFDKPSHTAYNFATALGGIFIPTGSAAKVPPTGNGSVSFLAQLTYVHLAIDWYFYSDLGVIATTCYKGNKPGDRLLYQCGIGHNIKTNPRWICSWLVEFLGVYSGNDILAGQVNCLSNSNVISIAPSLFMSNDRFILQVGIAVPVMQHIPATAAKNRFAVLGGITYKFNSPGESE